MDTSIPFDDREIEKHLGWVKALALQLVHDAAQADDIVQETLLAALEHRPATRKSLGPWLKTVLRRQAALALRGTRRRRAREEDAARAEALPSSDELVARADMQRAIVEAVKSLTEPYRSVVLLRYVEGLEPAEIARARGVPSATVRSQLERGLKQLRETLDARHGGDAREWIALVLPLAFDASTLRRGAGVFTGSALLVIAMSTWVKVSIAALLALILLLALRTQAVSGEIVSPVVARGDASSLIEDRPASRDLISPGLDVRIRALATQDIALSAAGPVRGRVIDKDTGTPLPHYLVRLERGTVLEPKSVEEWRTTDAEGRFVSEQLFEPGPLLVRLFGCDPAYHSWHFMGNPDRNCIEFATTWDGVSELEAAVEVPFVVELFFSPPRGLRYSDFDAVLTNVDVPLTCARMAGTDHSIPVLGEPPFARFPVSTTFPISSGSDDTEQWRLTLIARNGMWKGDVLIDSAYIKRSTAARIDVTAAARLDLSFMSATGEDISHSGISFDLYSLTTDERFSGGNGTTNDGTYVTAVHALTPGHYRLIVQSSGFEPVNEEISLSAGQVLPLPIVLQPQQSPAYIRGTIRTLSGNHPGAGHLTFLDRHNQWNVQHLFEHMLEEAVESNSNFIKHFRVEGIAASEYDVVSYYESPFTTDPGRLTTPIGALALVLDDLSPQHTVIFCAIDDATVALIKEARLTARAGCRELGVSEPLSISITASETVSWSIEAEGWTTVTGTSATFVRRGDGYVQEARMRRIE